MNEKLVPADAESHEQRSQSEFHREIESLREVLKKEPESCLQYKVAVALLKTHEINPVRIEELSIMLKERRGIFLSDLPEKIAENAVGDLEKFLEIRDGDTNKLASKSACLESIISSIP